jgi:hypothetical protein
LANLSIAALTIYVLAFRSVDLTMSSIQRPIGGTLAVLKRIFTPILGLPLLYGIFTYLTAKAYRPVAAEVRA